jgi:nicotinate-nucleotide adenylyltransferase
MVVAIYGGSFNPPHVGHALVAAWLLWTRQADAVWLLPVFRHAFEKRHNKALAPWADRLAWCEAFAQDVDPRVRVEAIEAELPTPSFTVDTLRALSARHPEHAFRLVVGADILGQVDAWREWSTLAATWPPLVVGRAGHPCPGALIEFPEVSSTDVRARLRAGAPIDVLVTARVAAALRQVDPRALWGEAP